MLFTSTIGASNILCAMIAAQCILHEGVTVKLPFVFDEWTASMNTGVVLAILIAYEIITMWRGGLINPKIVELHGFTPDKAGHLTGYITGTIMGWLYRQHHAEWRDLRRDSFWNRWVPTTEADPANLKAHGSDSISEGPGS
ncbi:uncharacterized protein KY384_002179 [Bacidia gigantensis]|uniref:uncharacterized protein n=1 Tax=Bacidia gigantensis TaxID=2732470 RepID=UPI001D043A10|nr:uncharacterized protein KY384_002179 [Bacidia gigantensis]KAG8533396.1 hypothetical protein KY384_002179 [Bacidia gigantensis]